MKLNRIFIYLAAALSLSAVSCVKESSEIVTYPRNEGEEYLTVSVDTLSFLGRGNTLNFSVEASYDGTIEGADWVSLTSREFPGDKRAYTFSATVEANATGADRKDFLTISTPNIQKTIVILQPAYNRPSIPEVIKTGAEFKTFLEELAPYVETGETITIGGALDMEGLEVVPAEYFNGILEGDGNRIVNMKASCPLITKNNGTIRNLTIDESCAFTMVPAISDIYLGPFAGQNYGVVEACENDADITISGDYSVKTYAGGITAYTYEGGAVKNCTNRGEIKFIPTSSTANAYLGGITGYSYGNIDHNDNYGPITCEPVAMTGAYFMAGISPRHQTGSITYNINHKEAKIYANKLKGAKSYVGCIIGYLEGHPSCGYNECYNDIDFQITTESYVGGLQGWQAKVSDASATLFEGSIVNSNIKAYTAGTGANGTNPCKSAGFITGRFSGQGGSGIALHYGTADKPIRVSGSITCLADGTKSVASAKAFQDLLDGDGSKTSVNLGAIAEADYNTIQYEVVGDGQTGPSEDLIVKVSAKLSVPAEGGEVSFSARGNYAMTVAAEDEWLEVSNGSKDAEGKLVFANEVTVEGDGAYYDVIVRAVTNEHTYAREGKVNVTMPMGSTETVIIAQAGNLTVPASLEVDAASIVLDPAGQTASTVNVTANYDATVTADAAWVSFTPATIPGDEASHVLSITGAKNNSGAARTATVTITNKDQVKTISLSQEKFVVPAYAEIKTAAEFVEFIENAGDTDLYPAGKETKLLADIDLKDLTIDLPKGYAGTFDGNGKSIKNWVSKAPLFGDLSGVVKNLTIDKTCSVALDGIVVSFIANNNSGTIENCINNAAMTITTTGASSAAIRMGTFVSTNKGGTIKGCVNNGAILFDGKTDDGQATYVGGIAGFSAGGAFVNCTNNAEIKVVFYGAADKYKRVGGMTGICQTDGPTTFNGCVNTKNGTLIIIDSSASKALKHAYAGALVGEIVKNGMVSEIKNCKSFGDMSTNVNNDNARLGGLFGTAGNWGVEGTTICEDCVVNCNISAPFTSGAAEGYNPLKSCGLVCGRLGGESKTLNIGSEDHPVKVAGTITRIKEDGTTDVAVEMSEANKIIVVGDGSGSNIKGNSTFQNFYVKFEAVTKE